MSNLYLIEILIEPNSLTIVTSKKIFKMNNYVLLSSILFFLIMRISNLQCSKNLVKETILDTISDTREVGICILCYIAKKVKDRFEECCNEYAVGEIK